MVPTLNESENIADFLAAVRHTLDQALPGRYEVIVVDDDSADRTWEIAEHLQAAMPHVSALHLDEKGRGCALKAAWMASNADVVAYMDVDLSTNLESFLPLVRDTT